MNTIKKLLVTLFAMVLIISGSFGSVALAADKTSADTKTTQSTTEDTDGQTTADDTINDEQTLEEGYYIDEQGQLYYDPSLIKKEEIIEEATVEDSEVDSEEDTTEKQNDKSDEKEKEASYSEEDLRLLSCLIYAEAGNQSYSGMLAVANVVLNRVESDIYWHVDTIEEVIYDDKWATQFSVTIKNSKTGMSALDKALKAYDSGEYSGSNPAAEKKAMKKSIKAAKAALEGKNNIGSYLCFSNKGCASYVKKHYSDYKIIGDQIFYRTK